MLQQMESDGITPTGSPIKILDRGTADGPLIEAPDLVLVDGVYALLSSLSLIGMPDQHICAATFCSSAVTAIIPIFMISATRQQAL